MFVFISATCSIPLYVLQISDSIRVIKESPIGGCRAQKEPGHGGLSTYETFILWLKFDTLSHFFYHGSKVYPGIALVCPGLQPPMESPHQEFDDSDTYCSSGFLIIKANTTTCLVNGEWELDTSQINSEG